MLLIKEGLYKAIIGKEKKPTNMKEDTWNDMDQKAQYMLELCLDDEVMYNVMFGYYYDKYMEETCI